MSRQSRCNRIGDESYIPPTLKIYWYHVRFRARKDRESEWIYVHTVAIHADILKTLDFVGSLRSLMFKKLMKRMEITKERCCDIIVTRSTKFVAIITP
jgi:hypothetical protein